MTTPDVLVFLEISGKVLVGLFLMACMPYEALSYSL